MIKGSCLCGKIKYEITTPGIVMINCHCHQCRKASGAAYGSFFQTTLDFFNWLEGQEFRTEYEIAPGHIRTFCSQCGSPVPTNRAGTNAVTVPAGAFDDDPGIEPAMNIFVSDKAQWHEINDDLPQYDKYPPKEVWSSYMEKFLAAHKDKNKE